jgi:hypothetical protein
MSFNRSGDGVEKQNFFPLFLVLFDVCIEVINRTATHSRILLIFYSYTECNESLSTNGRCPNDFSSTVLKLERQCANIFIINEISLPLTFHVIYDINICLM